MFTPKDDNMKWTAQYNFMDLYKKKNGPYDPDANIELSLIFSPIENVIILGAQKDSNPTRNSFLKEMMSMILQPIRKSTALSVLQIINLNMYISLIIRLFS